MRVFFYGLFMDTDILAKNGISPSNQEIGYIQNYTLKIGNRASLIPSKKDRAYGVLMSVNQPKIEELYAEPSVSDYIPEDVTVVLNSGRTTSAICYNLPAELLTGTNTQYAQALLNLASHIGLPNHYLETIKKYSRS